MRLRLLLVWAVAVGQLSPHFHLSAQTSENPRILNVNQAFQVILKGLQDGRRKRILVNIVLA